MGRTAGGAGWVAWIVMTAACGFSRESEGDGQGEVGGATRTVDNSGTHGSATGHGASSSAESATESPTEPEMCGHDRTEVTADVAGCDGFTEVNTWLCATGFVRCRHGPAVRVEALACLAPTLTPCAGRNLPGCNLDDECPDFDNGTCTARPDSTRCDCRYGCATDADCGEGAACLCRHNDGDGTCVPAECATNSDCPDGLCVHARSGGCSTTHGLRCQDPARDTCLTDEDCLEDPGGAVCLWNPEVARFECDDVFPCE